MTRRLPAEVEVEGVAQLRQASAVATAWHGTESCMTMKLAMPSTVAAVESGVVDRVGARLASQVENGPPGRAREFGVADADDRSAAAVSAPSAVNASSVHPSWSTNRARRGAEVGRTVDQSADDPTGLIEIDGGDRVGRLLGGDRPIG